jgi:Leucine-rich repeat (LRR) protein
MSQLDYLKCLQNSINRGNCELGSPDNLQMLFTDSNTPILEILIQNELTPDE